MEWSYRMSNYKPVAFIVPNNFQHKAGDGLSTRKHHCKDIHPSLQASPGSTQATYVLEIDKNEVDRWKVRIK